MDNAIFSPYLDDEYPTKLGGDVDTSSNLFKFIIIAILIIIVIFVILKLITKIKINGENYYQRRIHQHFNNIGGEELDDEAKEVIRRGEELDNPEAIDHFRIGTVQLLNARNRRAAHRHFREALDQIIRRQVDTRTAPFIINRITDFNDQFVDLLDVEELPIQRALLVNFNIVNEQLDHAVKKKIEIMADDPEAVQKTILNRQNWQSDSQNVHDSSVYEVLREQVPIVVHENIVGHLDEAHTFDEAKEWLKRRYITDQEKLTKINKILDLADADNQVGILSEVSEKELISAVWQRSHDPRNEKNKLQIQEALADSVLDCVENGHNVCMTGRACKIWQALAKLDFNEDIGILKTKQALRNEVYQKAAKVVDSFVGENGSASEELKKDYAESKDTEQVEELKETMKLGIKQIEKEYQGKVPTDQLKMIIEECTAVL